MNLEPQQDQSNADAVIRDYPALGRYVNLSESALRREVAAGRLRATKIGRRVVFRPEDVAAWLDACAQ